MYGDQFGEFVCGYWGLKGWFIYVDVTLGGEGSQQVHPQNYKLPALYRVHVSMLALIWGNRSQ